MGKWLKGSQLIVPILKCECRFADWTSVMMPLQVDRRWLWNARQRLNDVILLGRIQHQTADVAKHFDFQDLPRFKILIDIDWHMRPLFITRYQNFSQNHFSPQVFKAKDDLAFSKLRVYPDKAFADFHLFPSFGFKNRAILICQIDMKSMRFLRRSISEKHSSSLVFAWSKTLMAPLPV